MPIIPREMPVLDDFFTRALVAGVGLALTTGPLGCFIVWRRMAYFGDTMAHSALLGVAMALLLEINLMFGVFAVAVLVSLALLLLQRRGALSTDALLGILSHSTLALGLVMVAFMTWVRVDLMSFLFGDILAVSRLDILFIYAGGAIVLGVLAWLWRPLLAATVSEELAEAEGMSPERSRLVFMLLMALVIAIAMKIVGILLITSLLIIPAAAALALVLWPSSAGRWEAGAAGERATARALLGVEADGWTIFTDVRPPGRRWNLDHLLVGPAGVVVVETKQWRRPVRTWRRHPGVVRERVDWQVDAVRRMLGTDAVAGYLCVHGARVRRLRRWAPVGDGRHLRRWLRRRPAVLHRREVDDLVRVCRRTFE
jgi:zinc transport system permease protein